MVKEFRKFRLTAILRLGILLIGFCSSSSAAAQSVRAVLDKTSIFAGETVVLTIEVDGQVSGESPDVGRLTESFDILNSSSRTQIQLINNQQTVLNRWIFELEPKTTGTLAIPALSIGPQLKTNPLTLTVLPAPQLDEAAKDIFIEVSAEPRNPYVQEQVRYSERIFLAAPLADDTLRRDGTLQDALLQPLGEMKRYVAERDGRNYQVFERNYALIPEKSGELTLPSLTLRGRVGNRQPGQQSLSRGRRIQIDSEPITLQVRPRPADYGANAGDNTDADAQTWLPSWQLTLQEQWSSNPPVFRVGEPVTRTLLIEATGLEAGQLPELRMPQLSGVNLYYDQAETSTRYEGAWLVGKREQKIAIVPTRAGEITLPEISLIWWDTQSDQQRTAVLPAQTFTILPAASASAAPPATPAQSPTATNAATPPPTTSTAGPDKLLQPDTSTWLTNSLLWRWLSLLLFLLWCATLLAWWRDRHHNPQADATPSTAALSARKLRQEVLQACQANDAHATAHALLQWAGAIWPQHPPTNLGALALRWPQAAAVIRELDRAIYDANNGQSWHGNELAAVLRRGPTTTMHQTPVKAVPEDGLAPLYPQRS